MKFLIKIRSILTVVTNVLNIGRAAGWWKKGKGPDFGGPDTRDLS